MGALHTTGHAFRVCVAAALLSACGGSSPLAPGPEAANNRVASLLRSRTFNFTGGEQKFRVPNGVTSLTIVTRGAQGGGQQGGRGGRVYAVIPVHPQEKLYVYVGGQGIYADGGFNGGGNSGNVHGPDVSKSLYYGGGYGGGGASDIRFGGTDVTDRVIVAGGGGGQGGDFYNSHAPASGGKGGGSTGGAGQSGWGHGAGGGGGGGGGGSQYGGGAGGYGGRGSYDDGKPGMPGNLAFGGAGGRDNCYSRYCHSGLPGAGGGGGYYGGGGGGAGGSSRAYIYDGGGGGGGSSYIEPKATKFQSWQGWKNAIGDGLVVISWK